MKKQIFFTVLFFLAALPAGAQLYQPGEVLDYRASSNTVPIAKINEEERFL